MRAVVLGNEIAGLAVGARLARAGHQTTVLPTRPAEAPDGAAGVRADRLDCTPVLWMPAVYRDLFRKTGRPMEREVELIPLAPARRYVFSDGTILDLPTGSRAAVLEAFGRELGPPAAREWDLLIGLAARVWQAIQPQLVPASIRPAASGRRLTDALRPLRGRSLSSLANEHLTDERARRLLCSYVELAGLEPARASAVLVVLPYLEQTFGAWQVVGGQTALVDAVAARARLRGATIVDQTVDRVVRRRQGSVACLSSGEEIAADVVVDAAPAPVRADRTSRTAVAVATSGDGPEWPAQVVLLGRSPEPTVVIARPDVARDQTLVVVEAAVPAAWTRAADPTSEHVGWLLAAARDRGYRVAGDIEHVRVGPAVETRTARVSERSRFDVVRRRVPGSLRRARLARELTVLVDEPAVRAGVLRVGSPLTGSAGTPFGGLSAALVADLCGTLPRSGRAEASSSSDGDQAGGPARPPA